MPIQSELVLYASNSSINVQAVLNHLATQSRYLEILSIRLYQP
jgi:hypothetical protein